MSPGKKDNVPGNTIERLVEAARRSRELAYAPYSKFRVGAALLGGDGEIYTGCNVENASYGLSMCAERTALFKAVSQGQRNITAIAVISDSPDHCSPCGACRQVLAEFGGDMDVYMCNNKGEYITRKVSELLPLAFGLKE